VLAHGRACRLRRPPQWRQAEPAALRDGGVEIHPALRAAPRTRAQQRIWDGHAAELAKPRTPTLCASARARRRAGRSVRPKSTQPKPAPQGSSGGVGAPARGAPPANAASADLRTRRGTGAKPGREHRQAEVRAASQRAVEVHAAHDAVPELESAMRHCSTLPRERAGVIATFMIPSRVGRARDSVRRRARWNASQGASSRNGERETRTR
jgi:hypothetical protein